MSQQNIDNLSKDFLRDFVLNLMDSVGLDSLDKDTKKRFVGQFTAQAERRIGIKLMPKLSDEDRKELAQMIEEGNTGGQEMNKFWSNKVDNYTDLVREALDEFAGEMREEMQKIRGKN